MAVLLFLSGFAGRVRADEGLRDPFFAAVPFERWQSEGKRKEIRWDVQFFPVELSVHQRLIARVRIEIDHDPALEPAPRPLAVLIEYRDSSGRVWQTHALPGGGRRDGDPAPRTDVVFGNAFVLPGTYLVSVAVCDPQTLEHSFISHKIRAKDPSSDPLPLAWQDLPEVEFLPATADPPDEWFLPSISSRLKLRVATREPVRLDVFLNATPGGNRAGSVGATRRNMSVLIPSLKVISHIELPGGCINVRLLDLTRRRVAFQQDKVDALDWPRLRSFFLDTRPGVIDVSSLAGFWRMRNFLWEQVIANRGSSLGPAAGPGEARVVVILSGPAFFQAQEPLPQDLRESSPGARVFYIRYRTLDPFARPPRLRSGSRPGPPRPMMIPMPEDELQAVAHKLNAHVFDVTSAIEFRRALATIMERIAEL